MISGHGQHDREEHDRERKAEQEADVGGAPGAERPGQLPLHGVARDLRQRRSDGKGNPERGDGEHWGRFGWSGLKGATTVKRAACEVNPSYKIEHPLHRRPCERRDPYAAARMVEHKSKRFLSPSPSVVGPLRTFAGTRRVG